ncbi:hypothetical protein Cch01nite_00240 [Cellulomonas chitinilytica]|uniref:Twin-arginine translocation signal domain-containing protein n=1 Tax=Cellulomonas chitinilytica TaxID=398759 RepID=A0A919NYD4_9CELL|nr:hypothetical protein [Cellulomonas chitinilytica]GIG19300.1 hypothetical protein Cch01nite_00240 [Cellulomonas chitinilytica]
MQISQRNMGIDGEDEAVPPARLSRRGFIAGVGAGLGVGVLAVTTIGATPAAAATHRLHCNKNVIYVRMTGCWCVTPNYYCNYGKWCNICLGTCGSYTEIEGCC